MKVKKLDVIVLGLFAVVLLGCKDIIETRVSKDSNKVDWDTFEKVYDPQKDILIDVRTPEEYEEGHIENSINIDYENEKYFMDQIDSLIREQSIFIYCEDGERSAKATKLMDEEGFKDIKNIKSGIQEYEGEIE